MAPDTVPLGFVLDLSEQHRQYEEFESGMVSVAL